jgi:hypothetical protein
MRIKVSSQLYTALAAASEDHGLAMSDIWRRALRLWRRVNGIDSEVVGLSDFKTTTGSNNIVLSPDIPPGLVANMTPEELRFILAWYLHEKSQPVNIPKLYIPYDMVEGVDFIVGKGE